MDSLAKALFSLLRLASSGPSPLLIAPLPALVSDLFDRVLDDAACQDVATRLEALARLNQPSVAVGDAIAALLHELAAQTAHDDGLYARLDQALPALTTLLTVRDALGLWGLGGLRWQLEQPQLLAWIRQLTIAPLVGQPEVMVVGTAPEVNGQRVRFDGRGVLERLELSFTPEVPYPRLTLNPTLNSVSKNSQFTSNRRGWLQLDDSDYDLELFSTNSRLLGTIRTQAVSLPVDVTGARLSLLIPALPGLRLLVTTIADKSATPLAQCIKVTNAA